MAKRSNRPRGKDRQRIALPAEQVTERMLHRRSGAAGAHSDSSVLPTLAAGRKSRMGSRRAKNTAAIRDQL